MKTKNSYIKDAITMADKLRHMKFISKSSWYMIKRELEEELETTISNGIKP